MPLPKCGHLLAQAHHIEVRRLHPGCARGLIVVLLVIEFTVG